MLGCIPPYVVRESKRARRVILRIFPDRRLEVVVPKGFKRNAIPGIISQKTDWINEVLRKMDEGAICSAPSTGVLPRFIDIRAVGKRLRVVYLPNDSKGLRLMAQQESCLIVPGRIEDYDGCKCMLQNWLMRQAHLHLPIALAEESAKTGLPYRKLQIRAQRSRWGSCSSSGTISLNCKLLFFPPVLVRYVLTHELCHTVHLNHSSEFWDLVAKFEPSYKKLRVEMRSANTYVPVWA